MMNRSGYYLFIVIALILVSSCSTVTHHQQETGLTVTILHINDHHSKLDPTSDLLINLNGNTLRTEIGGFPRLITQFNYLSSQHDNILKLHAGDALTGTMYYTLFREELPDALMMNHLCFDAFVIGNHEFDGGNESLAQFLDKLSAGDCNTDVLSANIEVPDTNPIAHKYKPYSVYHFGDHQVGVIGITIGGKTQASSSPSADTVFLDEITTAQHYIDILKADGVNKIILLTHQTYETDITMAAHLHGVDVIVGGDSHSLLGDTTRLHALGFNPDGDYPTRITNADGDMTCIVHAWDNSKSLGELTVQFNPEGIVTHCSGRTHILLGDTFFYQNPQGEFSPANHQLAGHFMRKIEQIPEISVVAADPDAELALAQFKPLIEMKRSEIIITSTAPLCSERVPGQNHPSGSLCAVATPEREFLNRHGSVMGNIVAQAFISLALRADIAVQNSGGVRNSIPAGEVSVGHAIDVLPFDNYLVNLDMTGTEIINTLEDALDNVVVNNSSGAFPTAANLRFSVDMNAAKGKRVSDVEVRRRGETQWSAIDPQGIYVVVTSDFLAQGGDRYDAMIPIYQDSHRREDTGLLYTDSLINYFKDLQRQGRTLVVPPAEDMALQRFVPIVSK